jgi:hypothetical protein
MKEKIAAGLFIVAAVLTLAWSTYPLPDDAQDRLRALPASGFHFSSRELPLAPDEAAALDKARVLKRLYQVGDQCFVLMVVDGASNRHAVHDPVYCFRGAGWTVQDRAAYAIRGGSAALLTLVRGDGEHQQVMFWITNDEARFAQPLRYWWQATLRRITFGRSGPQPVLVILQPSVRGSFDWHKLMENFPELLDF